MESQQQQIQPKSNDWGCWMTLRKTAKTKGVSEFFKCIGIHYGKAHLKIPTGKEKVSQEVSIHVHESRRYRWWDSECWPRDQDLCVWKYSKFVEKREGHKEKRKYTIWIVMIRETLNLPKWLPLVRDWKIYSKMVRGGYSQVPMGVSLPMDIDGVASGVGVVKEPMEKTVLLVQITNKLHAKILSRVFINHFIRGGRLCRKKRKTCKPGQVCELKYNANYAEPFNCRISSRTWQKNWGL